jgi:hypothetical protein
MDLSTAAETHAQWKVKLRAAIAKREQMDITTLSRDDCCELGQWLHGEGRARFGRLVSHADCVNKHVVFHAEVAQVAKAVNAARYQAAETMLGAGTPYARASTAMAVAFMNLRKEANI